MYDRLVGLLLILCVAALDASARFPIIAGTKFNDVNGNGARDAGDPGIGGVTIQATLFLGPSVFTTTADDGTYGFDVADGRYTVRELPRPGWTRTLPAGGIYDVTVSSGEPRFDLHFGNRRLCAQPPPGMQGWWPFDEENGPVAGDLAGAPDVGTHVVPPAIVPGKVANALLFNGTSQYVEVPASAEVDFGTGDLSVDAWIRTTQGGIATLIDKRLASVGYTMFLFNGRLSFQLGDRSLASGYACGSNNAVSNCTNYFGPPTSPQINDGQWHHVAVTVDRDHPAGLVLYVDGNAVGTFDPTIRPLSLTSTAALWIGRRHEPPSVGNNYYSGRIDELELFDRALTAAEVRAIFEADAAGKCKQTCGVPSLIQSSLGTRGDFDLVLPGELGGLIHVRRDNDLPAMPWSATSFFDIFGGDAGAAALIQSNYGIAGNFEALGRYGDRLVHYWRDNDDSFLPWTRTVTIAQGVRGTPALLQGITGAQGDFELVVPLAAGGLGHYRRLNDAGRAWVGPVVFGAAEGIFDDASMIYDANGELQVVARIGDRLAHFVHGGGTWSGPAYFASGVSGAPAFVLGRFGLTSEVVAPLAAGGLGHWQRTYFDTFAWSGPTVFAASEGNFHSAAMTFSNYGHLEVVGQQCGLLQHYWQSAPPQGSQWSGAIRVTP